MCEYIIQGIIHHVTLNSPWISCATSSSIYHVFEVDECIWSIEQKFVRIEKYSNEIDVQEANM